MIGKWRMAGIAGTLLLAACHGAPAGNVAANTSDAGDDTNIIVPADNGDTDKAVEGNATDNAAAPSATSVLNLAPDGLTVVAVSGSARQINFGLPRGPTVAMVKSVLGDPVKQGRNEECGAGPLDNVDFAGGLTLFFQDGKFAGWDMDGRDAGAYTTAAGIGIGSTLAQIRDANTVQVQESSLGHEFSAGDLNGLLSANAPNGKVTHLWSGTTCIFR